VSYVVAVSYVAIPAVAYLWLTGVPTGELRLQLAVLSPRVIEGTFLLMVASAVAARKAVSRSLFRSRTAAGVLGALAFLLVSTLPPRTHRIYYDEDIYQNVAQNILWTGRAEMCNEGTIEDGEFRCRTGEYNKEPNAFPFTLSLVFRLFGVNEPAAHAVNRALFALGVVTTFWIGLLLFGSRYAAAAAAFLYLFVPQNLLWGTTVAVEPGAAAFAGVALGAALLFFKEGTWATGALAASSAAFASQWRPESLLILPVIGAASFLVDGKRWAELKIYAVGAATFALVVVELAHLLAVWSEGWGSPETGKFAWSYVRHNLLTNARYYVEGRDFPLFFTLLAVLGLSSVRVGRAGALLVFWFVLFFGIFIPFHAGSYRYGVDVRFALLSAMPLALLGGRGVLACSRALESRVSLRLAAWLPLLATLYFFTPYVPLVRTVGREAWAARADHDVALELRSLVPPQSIVLTHNPGMLLVMGQSAIQASAAVYRSHVVEAYFSEFPGGVYFHYNFWCNVPDPVQNGFCSQVLTRYPNRVIAERSAGFNRYVLYRLMPPLRGSAAPPR